MTRRLTLLLLLFTYSVSFAQIPDYFANDPHWRVNCESWDGMSVDQVNYEYYIDGDTVMSDGLEYKKMYFKQVQAYPTGTDPSTFYEGYFRAIRQEGPAFHLFNEELPLQTFQFEIGDTLPPTPYYFIEDGSYNVQVVVGIDSIETETAWLTKYDLEPILDEQAFLIEGIGHHGGLFYPPFVAVNGVCKLICYSQNGTVYFDASNQSNPCDVVSSITEHLEIGFHISPNPAKETIRLDLVELGLNSNIRFRIINSVGKVELNRSLQLPADIDIQGLPSGMYIIELSTDSGVFKQLLTKE